MVSHSQEILPERMPPEDDTAAIATPTMPAMRRRGLWIVVAMAALPVGGGVGFVVGSDPLVVTVVSSDVVFTSKRCGTCTLVS